MRKKEIPENLREWLENPYWAEYYGSATSDRCREYIALEFRYSDTEEEATAEEMDALEGTLGADDLRHLYRYCGNNPRKGVLARRIAEAEERETGLPQDA